MARLGTTSLRRAARGGNNIRSWHWHMAISKHLRSGLLAAGLGVGLASGCAMIEPRAERYVPPPLGSTWERIQHDTGSYGSGPTKLSSRRGEATWQGAPVITFEGAVGGWTVYAQPNGAWLGFFKGATPIITFDPPQIWDFPLEVGKSWVREQRMTIQAAKRTVTYSIRQKVESFEEVTVPAGTFKAFKISTETSLGDENVIWFSPELGIFVKQSLRRTARHAQGPGAREVELLSYKRGN
jgi:hypothetical protein